MATRRRALIGVAATIALMLTACGGEGDDASDGFEGPLVWLLQSDPSTLDPHMHGESDGLIVHNQIFDPLIARDPDGALEPALATSWTLLEPDLWEFELRDDVTFTNGEAFDAEVVKYNIDRAKNDERSYWKGHFGPVTEVEVVDEDTVRMRTDGVYALLPQQLTLLMMVPPGAVEEMGPEEFARAPIGTGGYKVKQWIKDERIELEANEDYWRGAPEIKRVDFRPVPDRNTQVAELLAGNADLALGLPSAMRDQLEAESSLTVDEVQISRVAFIDLQANSGPLADLRVRQAINAAINVDEILEGLVKGLGERVPTVVPKVHFGYSDSVPLPEYDPEEAKRLLEEAGWDPDTVLELHATASGIPNGRAVMDAVVDALDQVGIKTAPQFSEEAGPLLQRFAEGKADQMRLWTVGGLFEAGQVLQAIYNSESIYGLADDPSLDKAIADAVSIADEDERVAAYAELQQRVHDDALGVPLWAVKQLAAYDANLDLTLKAEENVRLSDVTIND